MIRSIKKYTSALQHLFFPHQCSGCGVDFISQTAFICARCNSALPSTNFLNIPHNPIENIFSGRITTQACGAMFYFTKNSLLQHLLIQLKYKNNREAGYFLGRQLGYLLKECSRFSSVDCIVPLPLHPKKEYQRGYNQANLIGDGICSVWQKPHYKSALTRLIYTKTQTHENRISRWENMDGVFHVLENQQLMNKHVLLIDDVITTGASLEACGAAILAVPGTRLSIATVAYTV
jgi:ComF family protein